MRRGIILIIIAGLCLVLLLTANLWLPAFLTFLGTNSEVIQTLEALVSLLLAAATLVATLVGVKDFREARKTTIQTEGGHYIDGSVLTGGGDVVARDKYVIVDRTAINFLGDLQPKTTYEISTQALESATKKYYQFLYDRHRFLSMRGMGVSDRVPLKLELLDLYVPLKARRELPEGETWMRGQRLAGRELVVDGEQAIRLGEPQPVLDLLRQNDGLIVLGDPGAGKTTFLKYLSLCLAAGEFEILGLGRRLPILVPLAAYANKLRESDIRLDEFIVGYFQDISGDLPLDHMLGEALGKGAALILLDGLDEVRQLSLRHTVIERVIDFYTFQRRAGNKFVLTSRLVGYHDVQPSAEGLIECTLIDFDDQEIEAFVRRWTAAIERQAQGESEVARADAKREQDELLEATRQNQGVRRLATNPLLLTILALMKRQGVSLPERRVQLYEHYVETLLSTWNRARSLSGRAVRQDLDVVQTVRLLAPLALWMHQVSPGVGLVPEEDLHRKLVDLLEQAGDEEPESTARHFLEDVRQFSALLLERGHEQYGFIHLTFEEYLAGVGVAFCGQGQPGPVVELISQHVGEQPWREVSLLAVGYLGICQQLPNVAGEVLQALVTQCPGEPGQAVVLAGEAVLDAWPGGVTLACKNQVAAALETTIGDTAVSALLRCQAGDLLGRLGDARRGVGLLSSHEVIPDIEWLLVPAGEFTMGSPESEPDAYEDEHPEHSQTLSDYYVARYPVTNAQYRPFVEGGGYQERAYWTEQGWAWRQGAEADLSPIDDKDVRRDYEAWLARRTAHLRERPYWWGDRRWGSVNRPVVGVCWYEALAYCRWLSERLAELRPEELEGSTRTIVEGLRVGSLILGLPNEPQWEKAARGEQARRWPWGDEFDPHLANTKETEIGETSPVGAFPGGASPCGAQDMAGNVWEWTRSRWGYKTFRQPDYGYPYDPEDGREALDGPDLRVLRGGSWYFNAGLARCALRLRYLPVYYFNFCGISGGRVPGGF